MSFLHSSLAITKGLLYTYQHQPPSNDHMKYIIDKDPKVKPQFDGKE